MKSATKQTFRITNSKRKSIKLTFTKENEIGWYKQKEQALTEDDVLVPVKMINKEKVIDILKRCLNSNKVIQ